MAVQTTDVFTNPLLIESAYMLSSVFFILSLGGLSHPTTSKKGNLYGIYGMLVAIFATFFTNTVDDQAILKFFIALILGAIIGFRLAMGVEMTTMPELIAALHSFVGIAATVVGYGSFFENNNKNISLGTAHNIEMFIGVFIGTITFIGSVVAFGKLKGYLNSKPLILGGSFRHFINLIIVCGCIALCILFLDDPYNILYLAIMTGLAFILGWHLIMAIGGADMPVVVSMLNSYSGWATAASGFMLGNNLLVISGALVGSSGAILSYIMCKGMNRSFVSVIAGGFGLEPTAGAVIAAGAVMQETHLNDVVEAIKASKRIIIVPGYGMAQSRCQHLVGSLVKVLNSKRIDCKFCIHPVAGRLPGHMNVLLAEAEIPYSIVHEMEKINDDFDKTDLVLVIGANDIVNPDALENPKSVIAGMPVCEVWKSKEVVVMKRSKATGYAAIENPLFYKPNCKMLFGDASKSLTDILNSLTKDLGPTFTQTKQEVRVEVQEAEEKEEDVTPYLHKCVREISVPKEVAEGERRVSISPSVARKLIKIGFRVRIEDGAGVGSGFSNEQYKRAGCSIAGTQEIWEGSEIIVKVRGPTQNPKLGYHEADALQKTKILISYLYPAQNQELLQRLSENRPELSVLALDCTPRITRAQKLDTLSSTANLAGYRAIIEAFHEFPRFSKPVSSAAGRVPPAKVLIMGAGVAGLSALGLAKSMGAIVRAFDARTVVKEQVESLGAEFLEVDYKEEGAGTGGYAKEMSQGYQEAQKRMIQKQAREVDVIVTTALIPGKKAPTLIDAETVSLMKPNSVIVDMAAEMGGNCELTRKGERYVDPKTHVIILGYTDLPSRMSQQSSELFATNMYNLFEELCNIPRNSSNNASNINLDLMDEIVRGMCVVSNGRILYGVKDLPVIETKKPEEQKPITVGQVGINIEKHEPHQLIDSHHGVVESDSSLKDSLITATGLIIVFVVLGLIPDSQSVLLNRFFIFILAIFIGYMVIWNVTPALHTPLMSVTNAISGIIVVGCLLELRSEHFFEGNSICGFIGVFFASINIFGGFSVTQKTLKMFTDMKK